MKDSFIYVTNESFKSSFVRVLQMISTAHAIADEGLVVHFILCRNGTPDPARDLKPFGLVPHPNLRLHYLRNLHEVFRAGSLRPKWSWPYYRACRALIRSLARESRCRAVYVRNSKLAAYLLRWPGESRAPLIFESHDIRSFERPGTKVRRREEVVYRGVDGLVTITTSLNAELRRLFAPRCPTTVVGDATNPSRFRPLPEPGLERRIIYNGKLDTWKGVDTLVRAMRYLPDACLCVAGAGSSPVDAARLEDLARRESVLDRIQFCGFVPQDELLRLIARSRVAVVPLPSGPPISRLFTSPLKIFEYFALGMPIVASDLPSLRDVLRHDDNAILVPPDDPAALAQGVRSVLDDPALARRLAGNALRSAAEHTWQGRARKIVDFIDSLHRDFASP